jgi:hypothetical protein
VRCLFLPLLSISLVLLLSCSFYALIALFLSARPLASSMLLVRSFSRPPARQLLRFRGLPLPPSTRWLIGPSLSIYIYKYIFIYIHLHLPLGFCYLFKPPLVPGPVANQFASFGSVGSPLLRGPGSPAEGPHSDSRRAFESRGPRPQTLCRLRPRHVRALLYVLYYPWVSLDRRSLPPASAPAQPTECWRR